MLRCQDEQCQGEACKVMSHGVEPGPVARSVGHHHTAVGRASYAGALIQNKWPWPRIRRRPWVGASEA